MIGAIKMNDDKRFQITDMETADWALSKIAEAENEFEKNKEYADMQRHKIDEWEKEVNSEYENTIDFMKSHLQLYLQTQDKKSIKLINGNIGFRKKQDKWNIQNNEELGKALESTKVHELIRVKKEPALSELKKHLTVVGDQVVYERTGEVIDGVTIEKQDDSFNVKIK